MSNSGCLGTQWVNSPDWKIPFPKEEFIPQVCFLAHSLCCKGLPCYKMTKCWCFKYNFSRQLSLEEYKDVVGEKHLIVMTY